MEEKKYQDCPICGTRCEVIDEPYQGNKPVEEIWESFWKLIVSNEDGTINIEQVKRELADFSFVMEQVPKVYCHITGDAMSKVMYKAEDVIRVADDHFNEALREAVKEENEEQGPAWVKASELKYDLEVVYHAKYDDNNKGAGYFNEEYEGGNHVFIWQDGADTFQNSFHRLLILDESGTAPSGEREVAPSKEVIDFVRDIATNWDCDEDGHKYNTGCRKCSASELLYDITKQQKEKQ